MPWPSNGRAADGADGRRQSASRLRHRRVQRVAEDVDRAVGARVARAAEQHHDAPGVRAARAPSRAARRWSCAGARPASARLMRAPGARGKATVMPARQPFAGEQQRAVRGDLMRVGAAARARHAADARDAHARHVRARGGARALAAGASRRGAGARGDGRRRSPPRARSPARPPASASSAPATAARRCAESLGAEPAIACGRLLLAKTIPSAAGDLRCPIARRQRLAAMHCANRAARRKLRQPQRKPVARGRRRERARRQVRRRCRAG